MRVLLVSLPSLYEDQPLFPLGIGYLLGSLRSGHEAQAIHFANMDRARDQLLVKLASFKPEVVGLTCSTFNRSAVRKAIRWVRGCQPSARIVVGGVHASYCQDQMLTNYGADAVVIGEGEQTLQELCAAWSTGRTLSDIPGIAYLEHGVTRVTAPRTPIQQLDDLPMPDYRYAEDTIRRLGLGFLITSRGCPAHCKFCSTSSFWGQHVRVYSPRRVVDEMQMLVSDFGVRRIFFHDDTFNLGFARVNAICKEITSRNLNVEWGCSCRVTPVSEEMIATMVAAGCRHIGWGIESGSSRILQTINKRITRDQIRNAFELCRPHSRMLSTSAFVMIGNPGENAETIQETIDFLGTVPMTDPVGSSILYVLPGTSLADSLTKQGYLRATDWLKYDTVPAYTVEHSYLTLLKWSRKVNRSVQLLPFDASHHLWRAEASPGYQIPEDAPRWTTRLRRATRLVAWVSLGLRKLLPGRRLRF